MTSGKLCEVLTRWQMLLADGMKGDLEGRESLRELDREMGYALVDEIRERTRLETEGRGAKWK